MTALTGEVIRTPRRADLGVRIAKKQLKLEQRQFEHQQVLDVVDRILPVLTAPVVLWLGTHFFLEWNAQEANKKTGWFGDLLTDATTSGMLATVDAAFIANALGGGAGIANLLKAVK